MAPSRLNRWKLRIPQAESDAFLHLRQVSAHMLGVLEETIPASWDEANAQSAQVLDPILAVTPGGIALADILLDDAQLDLDGDGRSILLSRCRRPTRDFGS